jgi:hypothetical protein
MTDDLVPVPIAIFRYRVLYSDGAVIDFLACREDSFVRAVMLKTHFPKSPSKSDGRIVGVAELGFEYEYTPTLQPKQQSLDD